MELRQYRRFLPIRTASVIQCKPNLCTNRKRWNQLSTVNPPYLKITGLVHSLQNKNKIVVNHKHMHIHMDKTILTTLPGLVLNRCLKKPSETTRAVFLHARSHYWCSVIILKAKTYINKTEIMRIRNGQQTLYRRKQFESYVTRAESVSSAVF